MDKFIYNPEEAHEQYREILVDYRSGVNLTTLEAKAMGEIIAPLLRQGLSPYQILTMHPELGISEKTLYTYIESGVFHDFGGIGPMDLRRQVSRRLPKKKAVAYKKRTDRKYLVNRTYDDFQAYLAENPDAFVTEMDTVYNSVSTGPFIQTFKFLNAGLLFAVYHEEKTATSMVAGVDLLESVLGPQLFRKYIQVLLTDRGAEFTSADQLETSLDGSARTKVFYCDPMQSGQKGSLENKHIELRYILPKGTNLRGLGLTDQGKLNLVLSHIDSVPQKKLGGKCPLDLAEFLYPDLYESLTQFGISKIEIDKILLKPALLKQR